MDATSRRFTILVLKMLTIAAAFFLAATAKAGGLENVTFKMGWWHEQTYAGFYAAEREGRYSTGGLRVTFIEGGPGANSLAALSAGKAHFATSTASAILNARAKGARIKAIACFYRRSPLAFAAKPGSGIRHPRDFAGKTIRVAKHSVQILHAMTARFGLSDDAYQVVHTRELDKFHDGEIDVFGGYLPGAILSAQKVMPDLIIIHPDNFGVHTYHNCLTTTEELLQKYPDLVRQFLAASVWGWKFVVANPSEVSALVLANNPKANADHELQ
ncbi:MAG: ABC transporter substrate-binding protein, partial [Rhodospirillaceae bacterium]|nr:ABC transporter substrate-binding protein [Rhodospirillaceae bacterium]